MCCKCCAARDLLLRMLSMLQTTLSLSSFIFDSPCFSRPTRHHGCGATRDLSLQVLSKFLVFIFHLCSLTTPPYRTPQGATLPRCLRLPAAGIVEASLSSFIFHLCSLLFHSPPPAGFFPNVPHTNPKLPVYYGLLWCSPLSSGWRATRGCSIAVRRNHRR